MKSFQDKFIDAFSKALSKGDRDLADEYISIMCIIAKEVWHLRNEEDSAYTLEHLQNNCRKLLYVCADSGGITSKLLYIKLLDKLYNTLSECVYNDNILFQENAAETSSKHRRRYFNILDMYSAHEFMTNILAETDIKTLGQTLSISGLFCSIHVVNLALLIERGYSALEMKEGVPDYSIAYIQQYFGWYLNGQTTKPGITLVDCTNIAKSCILEPIRLNHFKCTAITRRMLAKEFSFGNAVYICGLINIGLHDIAEAIFLPYFQNDNINSYHYYHFMYEFIFMIAPFCLMYYLGFWEEDKYVKQEVRYKTRELAQKLSDKYKELLKKRDVLELMTSELTSVKELSGELYRVMIRFDHRAEETYHVVVTGSMIKDFCLFSLLTSMMYFPMFRTDDLLNDISNHADYLEDKNDTPQKLLAFCEFLNVPQDNKEKIAHMLFDMLSREIKSR